MTKREHLIAIFNDSAEMEGNEPAFLGALADYEESLGPNLNDREVKLLIEAVDGYLDSREPADELEDLLSKLRGEPPKKTELKFGVAHIKSYGNYILIEGADSYHYTEREWIAIKKGFQHAGLPDLPQGMEGCFNLDDMYNMDIVRERLKGAPNFVYDPQLEQDFV